MFDKINRDKVKFERRIIFGYVVTGLAFILYMPLAVAIGPAVFFIIVIPFLGGGLYAAHNYKQIKNLSIAFKTKYLPEEMQKIFPDGKYYHNRGFTEEEIISSGLLHKQDRFASEDLIEGSFAGVNFKCCDITQKDVRSNGKSTTVVTVFQGRFYEFDFPKAFKYNLLLLQPYNYRPFSGFTKVKTENVQFNSEIKIYAKNEHEAFYILTPNFMEKIMYMDKKYEDKIGFSFKDNRLYIAIDSRVDHFDLKAFKQVNASIFEEYRNELNDILDFIRILQLDLTLFK